MSFQKLHLGHSRQPGVTDVLSEIAFGAFQAAWSDRVLSEIAFGAFQAAWSDRCPFRNCIW
ncbi:hypothetical protein MLOOGBEN_05905, partial [Bacillus sp. EB106-08-02-XG196]|uniref:hypothetical protein n=1 Tax=Bacillus sp. EB106-08-02-XG196 TaxID=2737049 RepID=UPI0015C44B3A